MLSKPDHPGLFSPSTQPGRVLGTWPKLGYALSSMVGVSLVKEQPYRFNSGLKKQPYR